MASNGPLNVAVPVRLDAFVLTPTVCDSNLSKVSPLTQPNYTRLRYEDSLMEHDIMPHHDIHAATPHMLNSRVTNLSNGDLRNNRFGVYLHWVLPRMYRSGTAATDSAAEAQGAKKQREGFPSQTSSSSKQGQPPKPTSTPDYTSPDFRSAPNRWLVIRRLTSPVNHVIPEFQGWILESDYINSLDNFDDKKDIEVEVSPFIDPTKPPSQQSDCFLGQATDCSAWNETAKAGDSGRADLSLLTSSNHLFADYQPHNGGVFSILDNFQYPDPNSPHNMLYLSEATASYYVLGWHADPATANLDPLYVAPGSTEIPTNADRLRACFMQLAGDPVDNPEDHPEVPNGEFPPATRSVEDVWLRSSMDPSHPSKVINHGAIYDVKFKLDSKPGATPADDVARDVKENVAVGTTTLDSLLAFVSSKVGPPTSAANVTNRSAIDVTEIEKDLHKLSTLLIKADDNVDSQLQAEDAMYEANFSRTSGGSTWNFAGSSSTPEKPAPSTKALAAAKHKQKQEQSSGGPQSSSVQLALNKRPDPATPLDRLFDLNVNQAALDLCQREVQALQWKIFAQWWNFVADPADQVNVAEITKKQVAAYVDRLQLLQGCLKDPASKGRIGELQKAIPDLLAQLQDPVEKGLAGTFYRQKDPTVFIAGVPSGWPEHFVDYNTRVRLDTQLITGFQEGISIPPWPGLDRFAAQVLPKLPTTLQKTAQGLIGEFRLLQYQPIPSGSEPPKRQGNQRFPSFHDESGVGGVPQSDSWGDRQPWFPLFIEWEAVYYHIPFSTWKLSDSTSLMGQNVPRWGIDPNVWLQSHKGSSGQPVDYAADSRTLSGRILMLPQPTYSLRTNIHQVFQNTDNDTLKAVGFDDITKRKNLERNVDLLPFVSAPLSGFNDHLLTLVQGTHIKPSLRGPGGVPTAIQEAYAKEIGEAGFSADVINSMGSQTDRTPYGNLVALDDSKKSPFKPVVHGQVEFTKLNIIDKFGQVVCAIDQAPCKPENKEHLSPAISDFYKPSLGLVPGSSDHRPDTVRREAPSQNSFFQLPPYLNQDARLNTYFVVSDDANKGVWRPVSEHENPLWGWILINYAEYGLQIFLADGTFYREVRLRDQGLGAVLSPKWLPFEPPATPTASENMTQLDKLIARLLDATNNYAYLHGIFNMINQSMDSMPCAPQSYAGFLPGLVGKPLALVNVGFSLELAGYPLENQSTTQVPVDLPILQYSFPVKVGDKSRAFDGLVGYFDAVRNASGEVDLDLTTLFTYSPSSDLPAPKLTGNVKSTFSSFPKVPSKAATTTSPDPTKKLSADENTYPHLRPYYAPTSVLPADTTRVPPEKIPNDANQIRLIHNQNLTVIGAIIDPFNPIHFYPAILPVKQLQLPPWTVESAMKQMTAFFHMGPLLLTKDVKPTFTPAKKLDAGYNLQTSKQYIVSQHDVDPTKDANMPFTLAMPNLSAADWNWLQPYWVQETASNPKSDSGTASGYKPEFNAYALDKNVVMKPKFEPGPYTAVEGYLQLTQPIVRPDY